MMDIGLTIQEGDCYEFEKTGIYPRYLLFYSKKLKKRWRFKLKGESQSGVLNVNKIPVFKYIFSNESICQIQAIGENE
tara:strand:- start:3789 stop:4022 length:234 start_codon:yes stop_codon:yes gene_type:complete